MEERTKKILLAIMKHCSSITETKKRFGDKYSDFENDIIYQNAILTPVTQIGELVKIVHREILHIGRFWGRT